METIYKFKNPENENKLISLDGHFTMMIEKNFQTEILIKMGEVKVNEFKSEHKPLVKLFETLEILFGHNVKITSRDLVNIIYAVKKGVAEALIDLYLNKQVILTTKDGKQIFPRTLTQNEYLKAMKKESLVFAVGPAGTGKTFLAVMYAVSLLKEGRIDKIILTRPVVEAGERLGFLPGDVKEKIDPYLIPLYDALRESLGEQTFRKMIEIGKIEIAPLAYMRGRTLDDSLIILDEAQNATRTQMKMFLTRLGFNSKMIVTGDISQVDLPSYKDSGLVDAIDILKDIKGLKIINFSHYDVMRHPLVNEIIKKYEGKLNK